MVLFPTDLPARGILPGSIPVEARRRTQFPIGFIDSSVFADQAIGERPSAEQIRRRD